MGNLASNVTTLKNDNRALILNHIRKRPMSRSQLSQETHLSKSAVTTIANDLIREGQLVEVEVGTSSKGRKPIMLDIVKDFRYALGVSLHRKRLTVSLTNLKSELVDSIVAETSQFATAALAVDWICSAVREVTGRNRIPLSKIIGIGISSPGPLDYRSGIILAPPNFEKFHNLPIVSLVGGAFDLPVLLENNSVLLAVTEYYHGSMKNYHNSMFVIISNGIGSCVLKDGQVYRGFGGYAGELGHISIDIHGPQCSCGNRGCLELYATLPALKSRFGFESYEKVVDDAYRGEPYAAEIIAYQADCLGGALAGAVNMFDLDSVILYGEFNYRPELLISLLGETVNRRSVIHRAHEVAVVSSNLAGDAAAYSSTAAVLSRYFNQRL